MKKLFTLIAAALVSSTAVWADGAKYLWSSPFNSNDTKEKGTTYIYSMEKTADNCVVTLTNFGSNGIPNTTNTDSLLEAATFLGQSYLGEPLENASQMSYNVALTKFNGAGKVKWSVYSDRGYIDEQKSRVAPTSDGGVVVMLKLKIGNGTNLEENAYLTRLHFVDGNGVELDSLVQRVPWHSVPALDGVKRWHALMFKVSAAGRLEWSKFYENPKNLTTEFWKFVGMVVDANDNIYLSTLLAVNSELPLTSTDTIKTPSGHAQLAVIKFDARGNYLKHVLTDGVQVSDGNAAMNINENNLYLTFHPVASKGLTLTFGDASFLFPDDKSTNELLIARVDNDLNVQWISGAPISTATIQLRSILVDGGSVYVAGGLNGVITLPNGVTTGRAKAYGTFIVRANASDGVYTNGDYYEGTAINSATDIAVRDGIVYLYSYDYGNPNVAGGLPTRWSYGIETYDENLNAGPKYDLATVTNLGTMAMAMAVSSELQFIGDTLIVAGRYGRNSQVLTINRAEETSYVSPVFNSLAVAHVMSPIYKATGRPNSDEMGVVDGGGIFEKDSMVTFTASAKENYVFVRWSNDMTDSTITVPVTAPLNLTAIFAKAENKVEAKTEDENMGTVCGSGTYAGGASATLTAEAKEGYHFVAWSNGLTDSSITIIVESDTTVTASFAINQYEVTLNVNDAAMGSVSGAGTYNHQSTANIKAEANEGYFFVSWSDGVTDAERTITVTEDIELTAVFDKDRSALSEAQLLARIAVDHGYLRVDNVMMQPVAIYDVNGHLIKHAAEAQVEVYLPAGIYIVSTDGQSVRVVVK
ncbi:MAG: InlB B-repeat-containing protein [Paludibacteraceae bacterium]|nr:InlB B-repeat-containing protein [Paludibacteraceae bacterium]